MPDKNWIFNLICLPNSSLILNAIRTDTRHISTPIKYKKYSVYEDSKYNIRLDARITLSTIDRKKGIIKSRKKTSFNFFILNERFDSFKLARNEINLS